MAGLNAEHVNPFLISATKVLKDMCYIDAQIGKPYVRADNFTKDTIIIMLGLTGEIKGQVMLAFSNHTACSIASKMIMMPITQLDELSTSAISELGNMILGNAATIFSTKGIIVDITTPSMIYGNASFSAEYPQKICIPLNFETFVFEINIALTSA